MEQPGGGNQDGPEALPHSRHGRRSRRNLLRLGGGAALGAAATAATAAVSGGHHPAHALASAAPAVYDVVAGFGADPTGATDSTAAIQAAVDAARTTNGGTVYLPPGVYRCSGQLDADTSRTIWLQGAGGETGGASPATRLEYTGSGQSFISARSSAGFAAQRLGIFYTNPSFGGFLIDLAGGQVSQWDTAFALVSDCVLAAGGGLSSADALVNLDKAIITTVRNCSLHSAQNGIRGVAAQGHYANAIQIEGCQFVGTVGAAIQNPGTSWWIEGCTFGARGDGRAGAVNCDLPASALSVVGCWMGDVTASTASSQVAFRGAGLLVEGNMIGSNGSATGVAVVGGGNAGVEVRANLFERLAKAVDLGSDVSGVMVVDNAFHDTKVAVTGTVPPNGMIQNDVGFGVGLADPATSLHLNGSLTVGGAGVRSGAHGSGQLLAEQESPVSIRQTFSTDGTGWQLRFAKNQKGQVVDLLALEDNGNLGLGVLNPAYRLQLDVDSAAKPGSAAWTVVSDLAVKDPRSIAEFDDGLEVVRQVRPVRYRYNGKAGLPSGDPQIGVIAQEVERVMPYTIKRFRAKLEPSDEAETELLGFDANALQYVLVNAVRELDARLRRLEAKDEAPA